MSGKEKSEIIKTCLVRLLSPLARFCARHSINIQAFIEIVHQAFVSAAIEELQAHGEKVNVMRVSTITGINRKLVTRLLKENVPADRTKRSVASMVIARWLQDKQFTNSDKLPRKLTCKGHGSEFIDLVRSVTSKHSPRSVLAHLESTNCITVNNGVAELLKAAYDAGGNATEVFEFLEEDFEDLLCAVEENAFYSAEVPNLHMTTEADEVPLAAAHELRPWFIRQGTLFHQKVRKKLAQYDRSFARHPASEVKEARVVFSTFSRIEVKEDS